MLSSIICSFAAALLVPWGVAAAPTAELASKRSIDQSLYNDLQFYFQYASSSYTDACAKPNGNVFVETINNTLTDTQGYIARDDTRKEIVFVFRGSSTVVDYINDFLVPLVPYLARGVSAPLGTLVHLGFQTAYSSVQDIVIDTAKSQLEQYPDYTLVTSGHSLGGALSSLAAVSLKGNFPSKKVAMYTYGQPRTGNAGYASWADELFPDIAFRSVHTDDGVPTLLPRLLGFQHHATEYWAQSDPSSAAIIKKCEGDEDPTCSDTIPSGGINAAHHTYYGIDAGTLFCS